MMVLIRRSFPLIALLGFITVGILIPLGSAQTPQGCQMTITGVDYPSKVDPGKSVTTTTHFTITCPSTKVYITPQDQGQVRLVDSQNKDLSRSQFDLPYMGGNTELKHDFTVTNTATASASPEIWNLKVTASVFSQGTVIVSAEQAFQIQVGQIVQQTSATSSSSIATEPSTQSTTVSTPLSASSSLSKTVQAQWLTENSQLYMILGGTVAAVVVILLAILLMKRRGGAARAAVGSSEQIPVVPPPKVTEAPPTPPPPPAKGFKHCIYCGATIPAVVAFCIKCGRKQQ